MSNGIKKAVILSFVLSYTAVVSSCAADDKLKEIASGFNNYNYTVNTDTNVTNSYIQQTEISAESTGDSQTDPDTDLFENGEVKENAPAFSANNLISEQTEDIVSVDDNSNAVKILNGSKITFKNMTVGKSGKSLSETLTKQIGLNSAVLINSSSEAVMNDCEILTSDICSPAFFVNGTGSKGRLGNVNITTSEDLSMGISVVNNGFTEALNADIETNGDLSAGIYVGQSGGKITTTGGTVKTNGSHSPAVYANGTVTATGTSLSAAYSPVIEIDGRNTVVLTGSNLSSGREQAVRIYQTDNAPLSRTAKFLMVSGNLTASDETVFYVANTSARIEMQSVNCTGGTTLLRAEKNEEYGLNGADAKAIFNMQKISGDITADENSTLDISLKNSSRFTGSVNYNNESKFTKLFIDSLSKFELTADCYIDDFNCGLADFSNIIDNGYNIYYNPEYTRLNGKTFDLKGGGTVAPYVSDDEGYDFGNITDESSSESSDTSFSEEIL